MKEEDYTLGEALSSLGIRELPPPIGNGYDKTWLSAIVRVTKVGGFQSYVLCDNDGYGNPVVKRDFGKCATILRFDSIHPYMEVDNRTVPSFMNDEEIIHYLCKSKYSRSEIESLISVENKPPEQIKADRDEINRRINDLALSAQKRKDKEEARVRKIKEYAKTVKDTKTSKTNGRKKDSKKT